MAIYDYKALGADGKNTKGSVDAENIKAARQKLKKQGILVTDIWEKSSHNPGSMNIQIPFLSGRVSGQEVSYMTRQLASLIKANIPLVEALNALTEQIENETLKIALDQVRREVNEGISLAKALAKHPRIFDTIFINMVEAGESSGTLGLVMLRLADLKEAQMRLRGKITSAMTYPALMLVVGVGMTVGIFAFVIPKLTKIFISMNKPIPLMTEVLMQLSALLLDWWHLLGLTIGGLVWLFQRHIHTPKGARWWDGFKLKLPILGPLIRLIAVTRFSSTMATLLGTGVPILSAMGIAKNLVGNIWIAEAVGNARENITEGQSIADPLRRSGQFPTMVIHMISIGEKTGELPDMLQNVADTYEEQVNTKIEAMTSLLEPIMILFMGGMVGFIVIAIFIPLMDLNNIK